jgi:hypothetical protein
VNGKQVCQAGGSVDRHVDDPAMRESGETRGWVVRAPTKVTDQQ